jgi:hypothetical protein
MIGPGWLPSRPRPLGRAWRGLCSYTPYARKRGSRRPRPAAGPQIARAPRTPGCDPDINLFDGFPADLPRATLRPTTSQARHHAISGLLTEWLAGRWAWLRPRTVPLIAALVGLLAVMGATKYLPVYSSRHGSAAAQHIRVHHTVQDLCGRPTARYSSPECSSRSAEVAPAQPAATAGRE